MNSKHAPVSGVRFTAVFFRAYVGVLSRQGRLEQLQKEASPRLGQLLRKLPLPTAWLEPWPFEELFAFVLRQGGGLEGLRAFCYQGAADSTGRLLMPLLRSTVALFGHSPTALLAKLPMATRFLAQGLEFSWHPRNSHSGVVQIDSASSFGPEIYASWESGLELALEACNVDGIISAAQLEERGTRARVPLRWSARHK